MVLLLSNQKFAEQSLQCEPPPIGIVDVDEHFGHGPGPRGGCGNSPPQLKHFTRLMEPAGAAGLTAPPQ